MVVSGIEKPGFGFPRGEPPVTSDEFGRDVTPDCGAAGVAGAWLPPGVTNVTDGVAIGSADTTTCAAGSTTGRFGVGSGNGSAAKATAARRTDHVLAVILKSPPGP